MPGPQTTCTLRKLVETQDADGDIVETWPVVQKFKGVLDPIQPSEEVVYGGETIRPMYMLYVGYRAIAEQNRSDFTESSVIEIGTDTYKIRGIANLMNRNTLYAVTLEKEVA